MYWVINCPPISRTVAWGKPCGGRRPTWLRRMAPPKTAKTNAANLNFLAFWRFGPHPEQLTGIIFVLFSIGIAAAEAAVGLALVISIYRHYRTADVDKAATLKG